MTEEPQRLLPLSSSIRLHFGALLGSWMGAVVDLGDLADGELGIALGGREPLVAEEFLDGTQVGALFEHVGAEGVAQGVGVYIGGQAMGERDVLDDAADAARGEPGVAAKAQIE